MTAGTQGEPPFDEDSRDAQLRSVVYVDDEPDLREVVRLSLSLIGKLTVHCFESGALVLPALAGLKPDLVLMDVMMPDMDGPAVLLEMQRDPALRMIPVIFMTAKARPEEVQHFRECGCIGIIAKPFDPMRLTEEVLRHWRAVQPDG